MRELAFNIVLLAVEDYKYLKKQGLSSVVTKEGDLISIKKLREFFLSQYCDQLIQSINLTGKDILNYLNNQYE